jgi:hypothetical protein
VWRQLAPAALAAGTLTPATTPLLALLCDLMARHGDRSFETKAYMLEQIQRLSRSFRLIPDPQPINRRNSDD